MGYVLQVTKKGYDVKDKSVKPKENKDSEKPDKKIQLEILNLLAYPYLLGAKLQLQRYRQIAKQLSKESAPTKIMFCLHEASCLFEDVATIVMYLEESGLNHPYNSLWINVRNHIRHDIRDNFDKENESRKKKRLETLGLEERFQTDMEFALEFIRIGKKTVYLKDLDNYLAWAEKHIDHILSEARKKGLLKEEEV